MFCAGACVAAFFLASPSIAQESGTTGSPSAGATLLERTIPSRWAIGSQANCFRPATTYTLSVSDKSLIWKDGENKVFVEMLGFSGADAFHATTVSSPNDKPGTTWAYVAQGDDRIRVTKNGTTSMTIVKCR